MYNMNNTYLFPSEYYPGNDVYVTFNNEIIDEIVAISFNMQQAVVPIYGYASYTWDAVAKGARYVQGMFRINFKESGYIYNKIQQAMGDNYVRPQYQKGPYMGMSDTELIQWMKGKTDSEIQYMSGEYYRQLYSQNDATVFDRSNQSYFNLSQGLDIVISYGEIPLTKSTDLANQGTFKTINDIQITGIEQVIEPTATNILEQYSFIARDVDNIINY